MRSQFWGILCYFPQPLARQEKPKTGGIRVGDNRIYGPRTAPCQKTDWKRGRLFHLILKCFPVFSNNTTWFLTAVVVELEVPFMSTNRTNDVRESECHQTSTKYKIGYSDQIWKGNKKTQKSTLVAKAGSKCMAKNICRNLNLWLLLHVTMVLRGLKLCARKIKPNLRHWSVCSPKGRVISRVAHTPIKSTKNFT